MTTSNRELLKKADIALADLSAGGALLPEQADTFFRVMIAQPTILQNARVVGMTSPQRKINRIGFGSRILRAAPTSAALPSGDRAKPDLGQITLNVKEVIAEIHIPYDVMEDNIERAITATNAAPNASAGGLHDTIVQMVAERAALDLEELGVLGDTTSPDSYLALVDGFLKRATAHVVDGGGVALTTDLLKKAVKAMPPQYLRDRASVRHILSVPNATELRDLYSKKFTGLGDASTTQASDLYFHGSRLLEAAMMPNTTGIYTDPRNLIMGIQRDISIEFDKDIAARQYIIVLTAKVDFQIEEPNAIVRYTNIGS